MELRERSNSAGIIPGQTLVCVRPAYYTDKWAFASHDIKNTCGFMGGGKKVFSFSFDFFN